jgi:choline dehydrogenase
MSNAQYDYIIVGGGSAGCVIATQIIRRTEATVLLLEAGSDDTNKFIHMPAGLGQIIGQKTWPYETEPQPAAANRRISVAQGYVLGGGSSVNGMIYVRGQKEDYESWENDFGCAGWGYNDVLPYFIRSEANESLSGALHGTSGLLPVSENRHRHPLSQTFLRAAQEVGLPYITDTSTVQQGVGFLQTTTRNGARASTAQAYLKTVRGNPRLTLKVNTLVHRVVIENGQATGVVYRENGGAPTLAQARKEVIVTAGGIGSAKVLLLSGIGPTQHLRDVGIAPVADLPVGENFHDHLHLSVTARTREPISLYGSDKGLTAIKNGLQWTLFRSGPVTSNILEAGGAADTGADGRPDIQLFFLPVLDSWDDVEGQDDPPTHGVTLKVTHVRPKARGRVTLRSADPADLPRIDANFLGHPDDLAGQVRGVRLALDIFNAPSMRAVLGPMISPREAERASDAALADFVRQFSKTTYHPVGTCRMGQDPATSVVDLKLRVHGVRGLRVADSSIFPTIVSGNTNAPTIMVGEKAVDLILEGSNSAAMSR